MPVALWAARLERALTEREAEAMLDLLPAERRKRLLRMRDVHKRREPLCAYSILRRALWEQYRWREFPEVALTARGKPWFPAHPEVHFSISHTAGAVLVGVADSPLGVDIERVRAVSRRMLQQLSVETEEAFFRSWVRREALGKYSGEGIADLVRADVPPQCEARYYALETFFGYAAGVAVRDREPPGEVRRLCMEELCSILK